MTERLTGAATILTRIMLALALALLGAALLLGARQNGETAKAFGLAVLAAAVLWKGLPWLSRRLAVLGAVRGWIILTALCVVLKGAWVVLVRVPLSGDYATFWGYANWLAKLPVLNNGQYMALFPHIFGYSSFLSWFIRMFGSGELLAQWLNVALTALSGSFLFLLAKRWWGLAAGASAYLLWIICPSQTIYNSLVLSEPLYTAMLLGVLLLLTRWEDGGKRPILLGAAALAACPGRIADRLSAHRASVAGPSDPAHWGGACYPPGIQRAGGLQRAVQRPVEPGGQRSALLLPE